MALRNLVEDLQGVTADMNVGSYTNVKKVLILE